MLHEQGSAMLPSEGHPLLLAALDTRMRLLHPCHLDILASVCALQNVCAELGDWHGALLFGQHVASVRANNINLSVTSHKSTECY